MSRVGKVPIPVPPGVSVSIEGSPVTVKGPKGELSRRFNPDMSIVLDGDILTVSRPSDDRQHRSLHGLTRTLIANMVEGVTSGFERALDIVGVGYRAEQQGESRPREGRHESCSRESHCQASTRESRPRGCQEVGRFRRGRRRTPRRRPRYRSPS